jgi:hypothetical protein
MESWSVGVMVASRLSLSPQASRLMPTPYPETYHSILLEVS